MTECIHYNNLFQDVWHNKRNVRFQPSVLYMPYDETNGWALNLPDVELKNNDVLVLHTQDFLTVKNDIILEIEQIEKRYPNEVHTQIFVIVEYDNCAKYYSGNLNIVYFPTFLYETICDLQNYDIDYSKYINESNKWMCLNGQIHGIRNCVANYLKEYKNGYLTLGNKIKLKESELCYEHYNYNNIENFINLQEVYKQASVNIICETAYSEKKLTHITEKTLFSFLALQIPIVIGNVGIVKWLEDLGFDMFNDIIDISYDTSNDNSRWLLAIDKNKDLIINGYNRRSIINRLQRNRQLVFKLPEIFVNKFKQQVNDTIQ